MRRLRTAHGGFLIDRSEAVFALSRGWIDVSSAQVPRKGERGGCDIVCRCVRRTADTFGADLDHQDRAAGARDEE